MAQTIKWIDPNSVLTFKSRTFKAGDKIPASVFSESRLASLLSDGKISVEGALEEIETAEPATAKRGRPKKVESEGSSETEAEA